MQLNDKPALQSFQEQKSLFIWGMCYCLQQRYLFRWIKWTEAAAQYCKFGHERVKSLVLTACSSAMKNK